MTERRDVGLSGSFSEISDVGLVGEMTSVKVDNKVKFKVNRNIRYTPSQSQVRRP